MKLTFGTHPYGQVSILKKSTVNNKELWNVIYISNKTLKHVTRMPVLTCSEEDTLTMATTIKENMELGPT